MHDHSQFIDVVISAGSNIEKQRNLAEAIRLMRRHRRIDVKAVSRIFESASVGGPKDAPSFFNAAVLAWTDLNPEELRAELRRIEVVLGRQRSDDKNAPRTIDLDISYFCDVVHDYGDFQVPAPDARTAAHVAVPIADVAPDWIDPETGSSAYELAANLDAAREKVRPVMAIQLSTPYMPQGPVDFDDVDDVYAPHLEALVRQQLEELGEDPAREGLMRTPLRVAKALDYLTSGYSTSLEEVVNNAIFDAEGAEEMVLVRGVEFYSMCEHHMLPFYGQDHRPVQDRQDHGPVRPAASGPGTAHQSSGRRYRGEPRPPRRCGGHRREAPVHDDAGRPEARQLDGDQRDEGHLQDRRPDSGRVPRLGQSVGSLLPNGWVRPRGSLPACQ
jgi:2-amino-4-hydroxy-6-hydroxymethyldihydropteridine diphosphokinase